MPFNYKLYHSLLLRENRKDLIRAKPQGVLPDLHADNRVCKMYPAARINADGLERAAGSGDREGPAVIRATARAGETFARGSLAGRVGHHADERISRPTGRLRRNVLRNDDARIAAKGCEE